MTIATILTVTLILIAAGLFLRALIVAILYRIHLSDARDLLRYDRMRGMRRLRQARQRRNSRGAPEGNGY
ncbi:MAG TPA: hypothetical protein VHM90_16640 [Phycisphaerae bacterium]|nr:hypothetical protein [Phycisphaerae bacterium]